MCLGRPHPLPSRSNVLASCNMLAVVLQVLCAEMELCQIQCVLRRCLHCIMRGSTVFLTTTLLKRNVKCLFSEQIRKAVLPDNAENSSPLADFIETHKKGNLELNGRVLPHQRSFSFRAFTVVTQQARKCRHIVSTYSIRGFVISIWRVAVIVMCRKACWSSCNDPFLCGFNQKYQKV